MMTDKHTKNVYLDAEPGSTRETILSHAPWLFLPPMPTPYYVLAGMLCLAVAIGQGRRGHMRYEQRVWEELQRAGIRRPFSRFVGLLVRTLWHIALFILAYLIIRLIEFPPFVGFMEHGILRVLVASTIFSIVSGVTVELNLWKHTKEEHFQEASSAAKLLDVLYLSSVSYLASTKLSRGSAVEIGEAWILLKRLGSFCRCLRSALGAIERGRKTNS